MMANTTADCTTNAAPKIHGPVTWDIRGWQNNWNWKLSPEADKIEYQTRFPAEHLALLYQGADASAPLLATIKIDESCWDAEITYGNEIAASNPITITMDNIANELYTYRWPVKVRALGGRELHWEYEHPAIGNNCMYLMDPATKEVLGEANDNYLTLCQELPEAVVEELVITGTAVQILLADLMHNDMTIATYGPEGRGQWKYQIPGWWDKEETEEEDETEEEEIR